MSVAAGIMEIERLIFEVAVGALRSCEATRIWMSDVFEPHHVFATASSDAFDGDFGDARNHQLAFATVHGEVDLNRLGSQLLRYHRAEQRRWAARRTGENRLQRRALLRCCPAVDIDRECAAALRHRPRRDERLRGVQPRNVRRAVVSLVDAECEDHIAMTLSWARLRVREEAGA